MHAIVLQQGLPTSLDEIITRYGDALVSFAVTVLVFIVAFAVIYFVGRSVLVRVTRRALGAREFSPAIVSLASSIAGAFALVGAFALAATVAGFGAILSAFATLTAALALAFGFAAQDLIANFVAGVFIIKDKPFDVGDHIQWNGNDGIVRDIRLRVTKLETFQNELLTVPNSDLAGTVVTNPVANETLRLDCDFGIDYDADIDRARTIIVEEGAALDGVLADPEPAAPVTALGDSAVVLSGRVWIHPRESSAGGTKAAFIEAVKNRFDAEEVGMPYPHTELVGSIEVDGPGTRAAPGSDA